MSKSASPPASQKSYASLRSDAGKSPSPPAGKSDFYFNLKPTMLDPEGAALLAEVTFEALRDDKGSIMSAG